ncbi:MAG: hypothetical protein AAF502_00030 [Bacteroidota bacterium]
MKDKRKIMVCIVLFTIPFICNLPFSSNNGLQGFHTMEELKTFENMIDSLPEGFNGLFAGSGECVECHGYDPEGIASVDPFGNDINVVDDWRATMMANSAKDPFWRAKVSHEVALYPQHQAVLETKCTSCHAPLGHFAALHAGATEYTMAELLNDSIALDGVSCLACHQQSTVDLGFTHSGHVNFDTLQVAYGPFESPLASPMVSEANYSPEFSLHIQDAGICAGCHTLITETFDFAGNTDGNTFVEQATYHEWLNSRYDLDNITCQGCHMPKLTKGMFFLIAGYETEPRTPFSLHEFAGANTFMLELMKDRIEELGITATEADFDATLAATYDMLQNQSLNLDLTSLERTADTAFFELELHNLAGHKFPSGYPSRRIFVEFMVTGTEGDTIFRSGGWDNDFELEGINQPYEPHYEVIRSEDEVQIYELVIGDVNGDKTTVLVRGHHPLKDNRLTPEGFSKLHPTYDTTLIAGLAVDDPNFNEDNGVEGTGKDILFYNVPTNGYTGAIEVTARVWYQVAPPDWMAEMFSTNTPEINDFHTMFQEADRTPVLVKQDEVTVEGVTSIFEVEANEDFVEVLNVRPGTSEIIIKSKKQHDLYIYREDGRLFRKYTSQSGDYTLSLPGSTAVYILCFESEDGRYQVVKAVR